MRGNKRRFLSTTCAVLLAFSMLGQTVSGNVADATSAIGGEDNGSGVAVRSVRDGEWLSSEMITNVKVDKQTYIVGEDTKVVVTFDVRRAADASDPHYNENLLFELQVSKGQYSFDYTTLTQKEIKVSDLKTGENKVEIPYEFPTEEEEVSLFISQYESLNWPDIDVTFSVQKLKDGESPATYTDYWCVKEQMSNVKTEKDSYSLGSEQTINVSFDVAKLAKKSSSEIDNTIYFLIGNGSYSLTDFVEDGASGKGVVAYQTVKVSDLKAGTNKVTLKARFESKGAYYIYIYQDSFSVSEINRTIPKVSFTVKAATDDSGQVIDTKASVRPQYTTYTAKQAATMKVFYTIEDSDSKYHLYIRKGLSTGDYDADQKYVVADFMSDQNLPTEIGKEMSVTLNKSVSDFEHKGVYTAALYNMTTSKLVGKQKFYVLNEKYVIQRDATKMTDDGKIPFYCDADLRNFDMDKDEKYSFQVCFPLNYKSYLKELESFYDTYGEDDDLDGGYNPDDMVMDNDYLKDDYEVNMNVNYVPAGSKQSRTLFKKKLKGMYKAHTVTLSSKEIMEAIYETGKSDISYAGVVTVKFSNEDDYQSIANEAIISFTESFKFGVSKDEKLTSAKASKSKVELAYGERAVFNVTDTLGGKIYADIYKGSEMIKTVKGECQIKSDGTAAGAVDWNLADSDGSYLSAGSYTAKVRTENTYTVFAEDGSSSKKTIKSDEKSINFTLVKPDRKLTLSTSVSGDSGGNAVYVEKPVIGVIVNANIGVNAIISVKDSKGVELRNGSAICKKGKRCVSFNLTGSKIKAGKYKVVVTATTLDGQKKKSTATFHVKKLPKASIKSASVSANSSTGLGSVSFKISEYAEVTVKVKSGSKVLQTVIDQDYSAGNIKASFGIGGYKPGNYKVVIKTKNSGGKRSVTKTFTVTKKPVVVKKPTVSGLAVKFLAGKDGDMVQGSFKYTGKNARVIIDIMYINTEEIVYTYQGVTKYDSAIFTYTWDGFKSNGFRCWPGDYYFRVRVVNSAGSTGYLRQKFTLGAG
ncbi:MAG: hypothetical protein VZQ83_01020 [Eubacterium sp.]|nr:hypothetical protein [Eubacterium sp.]